VRQLDPPRSTRQVGLVLPLDVMEMGGQRSSNRCRQHGPAVPITLSVVTEGSGLVDAPGRGLVGTKGESPHCPVYRLRARPLRGDRR
jgi:hypothetical protein